MGKVFIITALAIFMFTNNFINSSSNIKKYLQTGNKIDTDSKDVMPALEDLPSYEDITYKYTHKSAIIFESNSVALIVKYDDTTYETEKSKLKDKYTFLNKKIEGYSSAEEEKKYIIPEYEFSINSYNFRVVDRNEKDSIEFPKSFGIIGTSDEKKSIAYLYFYDFDQDFISDKDEENSMDDFVKEYFKYKFD